MKKLRGKKPENMSAKNIVKTHLEKSLLFYNYFINNNFFFLLLQLEFPEKSIGAVHDPEVWWLYLKRKMRHIFQQWTSWMQE